MKAQASHRCQRRIKGAAMGSNLWGWCQAMLLVMAFFAASPASAHLPDFTELVSDNYPAVVNISARARPAPVAQSDEPMPGAPFDEFLRRFLERDPTLNERPMPTPEQRSSGSGFLISSDGYILTNHHVVAEAGEVIVRLTDQRQFEATIVGSDPRSDLALLKIEANNLPFVTTGSASDLAVGEWVLAIGSPFGLDFSVTAGIVSAKQRALPNENYIPFIQTDVAINPGNSGGPLFNMAGEVVGINAQIYSRSGGFMGLSFAIPIDIALNVAEQLQTRGKVTRAWLGVIIQHVTEELADSFGMSRPEGALITNILPNGPAAGSELRVGDVIVVFNGEPIGTSSALPPVVGRSSLQQPAEVIVMRDGKRQRLRIALGELPDEAELLAAAGRADATLDDQDLGLRLRETDQETRETLGLSRPGVTVEDVRPGPAEDAGLQSGDVVLSLDGVAVDAPEQWREVTASLSAGQRVAVLVQRETGPVFLSIRMP